MIIKIKISEKERIKLVNIILNSNSITCFEFLYALNYCDNDDPRLKKFKHHAHWYHAVINKLEIDADDDPDIYIDDTTEEDIQREFQFIEHCYKYPNIIPESVLKINKALIENGYKPIIYKPLTYV